MWVAFVALDCSQPSIFSYFYSMPRSLFSFACVDKERGCEQSIVASYWEMRDVHSTTMTRFWFSIMTYSGPSAALPRPNAFRGVGRESSVTYYLLSIHSARKRDCISIGGKHGKMSCSSLDRHVVSRSVVVLKVCFCVRDLVSNVVR